MKHLRLLLPLLVLLGGLAGSLPLRADDDAARKAAAIELLQVMHSNQVIDHAIDRLSQNATRMVPPGRSSATPEQEAAFRQSLQKQASDILKQQLNWQELEPVFAQSYADDFSEAELKQLIDFYKSPLGQKLLEKQPEVAGKFTKVTQDKIKAAFPLISKQMQASSQKFHQEYPLKQAAPSPDASAGSSSVATAPGPTVAPSPTPAPLPPKP